MFIFALYILYILNIKLGNKYNVSNHEIKINADIESLIKAEVFKK